MRVVVGGSIKCTQLQWLTNSRTKYSASFAETRVGWSGPGYANASPGVRGPAMVAAGLAPRVRNTMA
jgi:hypothetical protein